ncbi:probable Ankyrin repeat-containing protein YIL001W [Zygosaccharomyces bailii]|nr:probable Ankyrin repeat-containing protein YIL001W [Zygosaccharomyces bailii]
MEKNFQDLCYACRIGDAENVDRITSTGVNLNGVDQFDNSPLFLASLCGHEEVVKLLLKRGAVCDRDRYEGARCIYGALTDAIRDILLQHDISKAVDINQPFVMHISSLIKDNPMDTHDICIGSTKDEKERWLQLHRFILSARSPKLRANLIDNWKYDYEVTLSTELGMETLEFITKFIYLVPVLHEITAKDYESLIKFSREWEVPILEEFLDKSKHVVDPSEKSTLMADYQYKFTESARHQLLCFVNDNIIRKSIDIGSPANVSQCISDIENHVAFPDILLLVENSEKERRIYPCHLAILSRASYFKMMFTLPMAEAAAYNDLKNSTRHQFFSKLPVISLPACEFEVAEIILRYLYYDNSEIPWEHAIDVLLVADYLQEDRMKSMAAVVMTQSKDFLKKYSIFDILYVAWETRLERLEQFAAKIIAFNLASYSKNPELKRAIEMSSQRISVREETDTIELVDDIRFYLLEKYAFEPEDVELLSEEKDIELLKASEILDYQEENAIIDKLLDELTLQA